MTYSIKSSTISEDSISLDDLCSILCTLLNNGINTTDVVINTNQG